ncbi:MAG: UDP-N-acetylmuramoyl-L-alanyl-D-glutamate--2,6-diaminopimelate ligase [Candidatus Pacebacteria bacterium]|nr:UDP-N-acetylmuramoyl-L-alanyl-D-glutamate--2,6-diaminopimelate ligase [Candidatus Paceibacterota bacterium]
MWFKQILYKFKRFYHFIKTGLLKGLLAEIKYGFPSRKIKVLAITGTDGKTTSSTLLYHVLRTAGKKVALISTVAAYIGEEKINTGFHVTTPSPDKLQKLMKKLVNDGFEYLVLETTSQGIYQHRTWGIFPYISGVTNISQDHFDYHLTFQNYLAAKALILRDSEKIILNKDDSSYQPLKDILKVSESKVVSYSKDHQLAGVIHRAIKKRFKEEYNLSNSLLVTKFSKLLDISDQDIADGILSFNGIPGRMEEIENKKGIRVVVDFAHTPQGLESALTALKAQTKRPSKLIAVYGSAGLRDAIKRPMMGKVGTDIADYCIFTAEDPRTEDIWSIIRQMKEQLKTNHQKIISIPDRYKAIEFALTKLANRGDTVAILGKGHEQSMCYGNVEHPWDDREAVRKILSSGV